MQAAHIYAQLSHAVKLKVGALIVKDDRIISIGYNGTPKGWDNVCEDEIVEMYSGYGETIHRPVLKTKPEVLHAERNALDKLAKGSEGGEGATIFITHAPCLECAKSIYGAGIQEVYYATEYHSTAGIEFLIKCKIKVEQLDV